MAGKVFGSLVLLLFSIPVLFSVIIAVGMVRAVLHDEFVPELADRALKDAPVLAGGLYEAALVPGAVEDPESQLWLSAMKATGKNPVDILREAGLFDWLNGEVRKVLAEVFSVLEGQTEARDLSLDMVPLKKVLGAPELRDFLGAVLANLPTCSQDQLQKWSDLAVARPRAKGVVPPCNPGVELASLPVDVVLRTDSEVPDEVSILKASELPAGLNVFGWARNFVWLLFLFPLVLLAVGAGIASSGKGSFLRWLGGAVAVGGLAAAGAAASLMQWLGEALMQDPGQWFADVKVPFWTSSSAQLVGSKLSEWALWVMDRLSSSVVSVGVMVAVVGFVMMAGSLLVGRTEQS